MSERQLFLLSPYRPPTSYPVSLAAGEAAAWLNGYAALWHPAALAGAQQPPRLASSYDHNDPVAGAIYALPGGPSPNLSEDWRERARDLGAFSFDARADRGATLAAMLKHLDSKADYDESLIRLFQALGYGYLMLDTLFDAANHDRLLDLPAFWADVQAAAADVQIARSKLTDAAQKLKTAREGLFPGGVVLVDLIVKSEENIGEPWPRAFAAARPVTLVATSQTLTKQKTNHAPLFEQLKSAEAESIDLAVGAALERDDALLPVESQLWSLRQAREEVKNLFGEYPKLYGRPRAEYHPHLPSWLANAGYTGFVALNLDGATLPARNSSVTLWPGPDGKAITTLTRDPLPGHEPMTFFNLAYHLHDAIGRESQPIFALVHTQSAATGYGDLLALSELADVFGEWTSLEKLLEDNHSADYVSVPSADEFFLDALDDRSTRRQSTVPVSEYAQHQRRRRTLDSAMALAALHRSLTPPGAEEQELWSRTETLEYQLETGDADAAAIETEWAKKLAQRLLARSEPTRPGWLILNSGGSVRRAGLELEATTPIPVEGPVKASEFENGRARVVVEVPGLGFAWVPRGVPGTVLPKSRLRTAEGTTVRNDFLEAELDQATGGLKAIRDGRNRITRFGQTLTWHPGSRMVATEVKVTHAGAALGEVTSRGEIRDENDKVLAHFTQRVRAWVGRPALELNIELRPVEPVAGYPWHAFFGSRFAWRDERAALFRGVHGQNVLTTSHRPQSPDYLEIRFGKERSFIFTGGLPFLQKQGGRMVDVVLVPAGETETVFELLIAFDRDWPMPTAQTWLTPPPVVAVDKGPPPTGASGWLANFDLPSLLLTSLRPAGPGRSVVARFMETSGYAGSTELRFAKTPQRATMVDLTGETTMPITMQGDAVPLDCSANELFSARIEWD